MKKIIKNGIVVTMNEAGDVWDHGYVMFEDTKILAAGPEEEPEKALQALTAQGILKAGETFEEIDAKRDIALSMPAVLGLDGVETHVPISLNEDETTRLIQSAETRKGIAEGLEL